jgi:hypothetical protein
MLLGALRKLLKRPKKALGFLPNGWGPLYVSEVLQNIEIYQYTTFESSKVVPQGSIN